MKSSTFALEVVPFPRRLQNYCCDDWREAQDVKILEAYDHTLPQKEKLPGSFTLPCFIHNVSFDKALVDLGASNWQNVIFPIDFIILDIPEDDDVPLILGRPFLSIAHSKIDVYKRNFTLRLIGEDNESFNPLYGNYIELNDLDTPLEPETNQDVDFEPNNEPDNVKTSSKRHFKTLSLDELRSPDFNLLSDQEYSKEEVAETMAETMEQYMSKTRDDYGSGVARPKIEDNFELKGQFLKELRTNTFSGSDHEDANQTH
ncbi:hypothetical protein Tco_0411324 [Tanacetum coccineum]